MKQLTIFVALVSMTATTSAQPAGAQAEVLFRHGRELLDAGKIAEACAAFQESQKLEPAVTTLVNLAGCREQNHELATAWGLFLDAERQTRGSSDPASQQLLDIAQAKAAALEPRVSKLMVNVPDKSRVQGLEIKRDAQPIEPVMWNRALPIDGGTYTIEAHAPGSETWSTKITVGAEADTKTVDVPDLASLPRDLTVKAPPPVVEPEQPSHVAAFVVGGGAVAALGGALAFDLWAHSTWDDAKAEMTDQARRDSLYSSANTKYYVAQGLTVAGIAAAGVAVWLYVRGGDDSKSEQATTFVVSPTGAALAGTF
jgi:hypothetical protein